MADFEDPTASYTNPTNLQGGSSLTGNSWSTWFFYWLRFVVSVIETMLYSKHDMWTAIYFICAIISFCCVCVCGLKVMRNAFVSPSDVLNNNKQKKE